MATFFFRRPLRASPKSTNFLQWWPKIHLRLPTASPESPFHQWDPSLLEIEKRGSVTALFERLLNRFLWMQEFYPLGGDELLLFKTSISFIDHLQEFLGALLTTCTLVIPPFNELKENSFYVHDFLQAYTINRLIAVPSLMRVSGDCSYFDCKRLLSILENEALDSVPIGMPMSNCDLVLVGEESPMQGEIYVGGLCTAKGYYCDFSASSQEFVKSPICSSSGCFVSD
ncbi:hypothetical protein RHMOL_Rhmol01G0204200 [Rhododendron molle]|uniref:Uncharacterized protein n=1 Tax=Rhododendron molle TaxID=49168 RepID=A0ACC0Q3U1_RHOML|nr:hypothetical protein RHMOL_Rhmol01G0204200 [Rhododendron molle]